MGEKPKVIEYASGPRGGGGCGAIFLESIAGFAMGIGAWMGGSISRSLVVALVLWTAVAVLIGTTLYRRHAGYAAGFLIVLGLAGLMASLCGLSAFY